MMKYLNPMDAEQKLLQQIKAPAVIGQIEIQGLRVNYLTAGSGKPLLLLHGANMGWGQWYANIAELSEQFTVYALDLPGAGNSSKIGYDEMDFENHFVGLVEKFLEYNWK